MNLAPFLRQRYFDANGNPLAGGKLYSYAAGTTTPQATYTDSSGDTENTNPVVLDSNGEAPVWVDPSLSYKFVLADADDVLIMTVDNVVGLVTADAVVTASIQDGAVTTPKLADDSVTADKLKDSASVDNDRAVTTNHIRNSAVTTAKIADGNVTGAKLDPAIVDGSTIEISTNVIRVKDTGIVTAKLADGAVTQAKRAALGHKISESSGTFSTSSSSLADVTNLSVSITTTGRPVMLALIADGSSNASGSSTKTGSGIVAFVRDSTVIAKHLPVEAVSTPSSGIPLFHIDIPSAGTYTYKVQASGDSFNGFVTYVRYMKLVAFEL